MPEGVALPGGKSNFEFKARFRLREAALNARHFRANRRRTPAPRTARDECAGLLRRHSRERPAHRDAEGCAGICSAW
jgi:hypothetical protein